MQKTSWLIALQNALSDAAYKASFKANTHSKGKNRSNLFHKTGKELHDAAMYLHALHAQINTDYEDHPELGDFDEYLTHSSLGLMHEEMGLNHASYL